MNCNECWFGEVFKDSKNNFCARSYTLISIWRTVLLTAFLLLTNNYQDNLTRLASSKVYYLFVVQLVYTIATFAIRPLDKIEANLTLLVNESIFLILCCLLMYFNIQSRWNDAIVNVFQYIITANGMIVTLIVTSKFSCYNLNSNRNHKALNCHQIGNLVFNEFCYNLKLFLIWHLNWFFITILNH